MVLHCLQVCLLFGLCSFLAGGCKNMLLPHQGLGKGSFLCCLLVGFHRWACRHPCPRRALWVCPPSTGCAPLRMTLCLAWRQRFPLYQNGWAFLLVSLAPFGGVSYSGHKAVSVFLLVPFPTQKGAPSKNDAAQKCWLANTASAVSRRPIGYATTNYTGNAPLICPLSTTSPVGEHVL